MQYAKPCLHSLHSGNDTTAKRMYCGFCALSSEHYLNYSRLRCDAVSPKPHLPDGTELDVSLTVHHELTIQNYQRDALNIIYSSNIITLLYMFRVPSTHLQEDIVVHKQHMVPSLSIRVLVSC